MFCDNHTRLSRRLRHCSGRLLCGGGVAAHPPEGTPREEQDRGLVCHPRHHHAAERRRSVAIIATGLGSGSKFTRHVAVPAAKRCKIHVDTIVRDWFLDMLDYHLCKNNYRFDVVQIYCFRINFKL